MRMLDAMKKDTAVAFSRIDEERREAYGTDGVPERVYRGAARAVGGIRAGLVELEAGVWFGGRAETVAGHDCCPGRGGFEPGHREGEKAVRFVSYGWRVLLLRGRA